MEWWKWLIIALVAALALYLIFYFINRAFSRKYGFSLYVGAFIILIAAALIGVGVLLLINVNTIFAAVAFAVGGILALIVLIFDFKSCGGAGILAFLLQILFCVPTVFVIFDLIFNKGRNTVFNVRRDARRNRRNKSQDYDYYD